MQFRLWGDQQTIDIVPHSKENSRSLYQTETRRDPVYPLRCCLHFAVGLNETCGSQRVDQNAACPQVGEKFDRQCGSFGKRLRHNRSAASEPPEPPIDGALCDIDVTLGSGRVQSTALDDR